MLDELLSMLGLARASRCRTAEERRVHAEGRLYSLHVKYNHVRNANVELHEIITRQLEPLVEPILRRQLSKATIGYYEEPREFARVYHITLPEVRLHVMESGYREVLSSDVLRDELVRVWSQLFRDQLPEYLKSIK